MASTTTLIVDDPITRSLMAALPVVKVLRGQHLVATDGYLATITPDGGAVVGYLKFGWALYEPKPLAKALKSAPRTAIATLPGGGTGFVAWLKPEDALAFGVDLIEIDGVAGAMAFTAQAYASVMAGRIIARLDEGDAEERSTSPLHAVPIGPGLDGLRAGSTRDIAERTLRDGTRLPALAGIPALPEAAAVTFDAGREVAAPVANAGLAALLAAQAAQVTVGAIAPQTPSRNPYQGNGGYRNSFGRGRSSR